MSREPTRERAKYETCKRYSEPGHAHALTFSCFKRQPLLSRDRSRTWFLEALDVARTKHAFDLWAYVIMPEHVHLLIWPRNEVYSISDILSDMKLPVTRRAVKYLREHAPAYLTRLRDEQPNGKVVHRFWQRGGGFDRNLVQPAAIHRHIEYIHANPVRRGLVEHPEDWPWSSARYFAGRGDVPLVPDVESIPGYC
ncbi:MAG: transposase [Phycisphaerae bacterium]|nr:transposase [Phycisphaerae bacterium]